MRARKVLAGRPVYDAFIDRPRGPRSVADFTRLERITTREGNGCVAI